MTELQQCEFNILRETVQVCDALGLQYYLVCGSALGAAKYGGFIPWDDDVDIGMFREDYERFIEKAPELLPESYFLQNYKSDPAFPMIFSKIRDSRTTYIEKSAMRLSIHHGIYIDIFPLDGYPADPAEQRWLERKKKIYSLLAFSVFDLPRSWKGVAATRIARLLGYHRKTGRIVDKLSELLSSYAVGGSALICNHGNWQGKLEYAPREQYGEGVFASFEGLRVRIPEKYDEYLTQKYGDWRADLPEDEQVGHHYYEVCDLTHPYTDYIERLPNGKICLKKKEEIR